MAQEELENTQEQYDNEYEKAFFGEGENDEQGTENGETEQNEEVDQGTEADAEGSTDGDSALEGTDEGGEDTGDTQEDTESVDDADTTDDEPDETVEKRVLKWNGEDIEVTMDELIALGQKGFDYTSKMQNVSKYRKDLESAGITDEVLDLMKRVQTGDKMAFAKLAEMNKIDPIDILDVDTKEYQSNTPLNDDRNFVVSEEVKPLMEQVMSNPQLQSKMERAEQVLPNAVIARMAQDADLMYNAVHEIDSGSFDQVMPRVEMRLATLSDLDREYALNSPEVFGNLYLEEKSRLSGAMPQAEAQPQAREPQRVQRNKPNMAEVGVKKSNNSVRKQDVIKDAFTDDKAYQEILDRLNR